MHEVVYKKTRLYSFQQTSLAARRITSLLFSNIKNQELLKGLVSKYLEQKNFLDFVVENSSEYTNVLLDFTGFEHNYQTSFDLKINNETNKPKQRTKGRGIFKSFFYVYDLDQLDSSRVNIIDIRLRINTPSTTYFKNDVVTKVCFKDNDECFENKKYLSFSFDHYGFKYFYYKIYLLPQSVSRYMRGRI